MQRYDVRARSSAPPRVVYDLLLRGATWPQWSPIDAFADPAAADRGARQGPGAVRAFTTGGRTTSERVVALVPDRRMDYEGVTGPMRRYRASVELEDDAGGTAIRWHGVYRWRPRVLGPVLAPVLGRFMQRMADGLAAGAERETWTS